MLIPLINPSRNPNRPPKKWWYATLAKVKKTRKYRHPEKIVGDIWFHKISPAVKKRILRQSESPAVSSRRINQPSHKESGMVYSLKSFRRKHRAHRRRRHNPHESRGFSVFGRARAKHSRKRRISRIWHRPRLARRHGKWYRPKRSRLFKHRTWLNPGAIAPIANPRRHRRHYRHNPLRIPFGIDRVAVGGLKVAGGLAIGMVLMPVLVKYMPVNVTVKYRKFYGIIHIVLGAVGAAVIKNRMVKDLSLVVAAAGVYDLIASMFGKSIGLPTLPNHSPLPMLGLSEANAKVLTEAGISGDETGVIGSSYQTGADYEPAFGASYQQIGADDISYGGDSLTIE